MPSVYELAGTDYAAVGHDMQRLSRLRDQEYEIVEQGEFNKVLLGDKLVVKIPRNDCNVAHTKAAHNTALFEARVTAGISENALEPSPLVTPHFIESNTYNPPYYNVFTRVPGHVLSRRQVQDFSKQEKQLLGERTGMFVAWLGKTMTLDSYREIIEDTSPPIIDRVDYLKEGRWHTLNAPKIDYAVGDIILATYEAYEQRLHDGSLKPSIVGHDDLWASNITFMKQEGQWVPHGVFDFGITKPSRPERELRHLAPIGAEALDAGIQAYEAQTGYQVDMKLLGFWALAQASTTHANKLIQGDPEQIEDSRAGLQTILENEAFGELRHCGKMFMRHYAV
jgi:hypothetical protein